MTSILIAAVVVLMVLLVAAKFISTLGSSSIEYPYILNKTLFSAAERSFLGVLEQVIGDEYRNRRKVFATSTKVFFSRSNYLDRT